MPATQLTLKLGIRHPIIQAPMAGGGDTPELIAAVCNAGAIGFIGAAYLSPEQIRATAKSVRAQTTRPFGINLFAPTARAPEQDASAARARVKPYYDELGIPLPELVDVPLDAFARQLEAAFESGASCLSFTFGRLPDDAVAEAKAAGIVLMGTATTVSEALQLEADGVDFVVAQGAEAGGHRGSFAVPFASGMIGTIALVPQMADALRIPVLASGGIMDGRGIAAALALGACGVQLGTAFLTTQEAGIVDAYKEAILAAQEDETRITRAFSGRPARGIVNRFMREVEEGASATDILPFPLQNALTRPLRTAAAKAGKRDFLSLWAGQGVRMARQMTAAELVLALVRETDAALLAAKGG